MTQNLTRRRFLTISAAFGLMGATPARANKVVRWSGRALGAHTSMILTGLSKSQARPVFRAVEQELARLEKIFSLYIEGSAISRLNSAGYLTSPAPELLDVLSLSSALHRATFGAFDPTVQPVWQARALGGDVEVAQMAVGWGNVRFDTREVRLMRPGMALTLNGIAQGYITDRIAALLRRRGLDKVLIDMGEIAALGTSGDGRDWRAGIATPDGTIVHRVALRDRALATSAPMGTVLPGAARPMGTSLPGAARQEHIIHPANSAAGPKQALVSISAPLAAVADGLSTACCLLDRDKARSALTGFAGARIELFIQQKETI